MTHRPLLFFFVAALLWFDTISAHFVNAADSTAVAGGAPAVKELNVGDKAPALDIETWLNEGQGYFKPVTKFKEGHVYVIEFWATWCGPCRISMPMLAELQNKYRGQDVQVIGVSNESTDLIATMLKQQHAELGKTFGEITSAYSLATDPDNSVHADYMEATGSEGIPTAFIVGKTGILEWYGSPFDMDEPLEKVVDDTWDMAAFKAEMDAKKQLQKNIQTVAGLEEAGKYDEAIAFSAARAKDAPNEQISGYWNSIQNMLKLVSNKMDDETKAYFADQFEMLQTEGNLQGILQLSNELYSVSEMGGETEPLGKQAIAVVEAIGVDDAPEEYVPYYHNTLAHLFEMTGDFKKAAAAQTKAMSLLDVRQQQRMLPYLKELRDKAAKAEEK